MAVFLRRSDDLGDIDSSIHWYPVTGTKINLPIDLKLPNLGSLLEKEFDRVRDQWWKIGKKLGQTISARLAHMPTAASYNSDFGLMMAWVGLTNRVCKESNPCLVVCDDPWLFRELEGIDGIAAGRRPPIWPQTVRGWARGYLARTILALRLVITSLLLRYTRKNICSGNNVLIVYGHPQSKADGDDTYFGSLMTHIPSLRRLIHTDADLGNTRRLSRKRTAGLHAWGSIFFAPLIIFKRWRPRQADITGEFSWLIRRAVAFENSTAAIATNSWQIHCQRRWIKKNKPAIIVWPWENHPWERELCRCAKKFGVKTIGYQHAVIGPQQFNPGPASNPDGFSSIPDRIICSGPAYHKQLIRWGIPKTRLTIGGAFRISRFIGEYFDRSGPVFVATSADTEITKKMMKAVNKAQKEGRKFLVKIHPLYPKKVEESESIVITNNTIPEQKGISAVFYGTGTSGLEGLLAGLPTFRLRPDDRIAVNVLPEGIDAVPISVDQLGEALDNAVKPNPLKWGEIYAPVRFTLWEKELEFP